MTENYEPVDTPQPGDWDYIAPDGAAQAEAAGLDPKRFAEIKARMKRNGQILDKPTPEAVSAAMRTEQIMREGYKAERERERERANASIRDEGLKLWEKDCAAITTPACFLHMPTGTLLSDKAFAKKYGHLFGDKSPITTANKSKKIMRYDGLTFQPPVNAADLPVRVVIEQGISEKGFANVSKRLYNTYRANPLLPLTDRKPDLFLNHLRYLIPNVQERQWLADWMAWTLQHPGQKPQFAILLIGGEGTGKSWLADLLKVMQGPWNVSTPRNKSLVRDFNGWCAERTLAIVHELKGRVETSENLKDIITQSTVEINRKGIEAHEVPNHIAIFAISNHDDPIPLDDGSRRYLVIQCAEFPRYAIPEPSGRLPYTRTPKMIEYYAELMASQDPKKPTPTEETQRVLGWLLARDLNRPGALNCLSIAPETEAKGKVVDAGRTSLEKAVADAHRNKELPFARVFALSDVIPMLEASGSQFEGRERTTKSVTTACRKMGCAPIIETQVRTDFGRKHLWARTAQDAGKLANENPRALAKLYHDGRKIADIESAERNAAEMAADFGPDE